VDPDPGQNGPHKKRQKEEDFFEELSEG